MSYEPHDFNIDALGCNYFLGSANANVLSWTTTKNSGYLQSARIHLERLQEAYLSDRVAPPLQLSQQAATVLVRHYALSNQLGLAEIEIVSAMVLGKIETAIKEIDRLLKEVHG